MNLFDAAHTLVVEFRSKLLHRLQQGVRQASLPPIQFGENLVKNRFQCGSLNAERINKISVQQLVEAGLIAQVGFRKP